MSTSIEGSAVSRFDKEDVWVGEGCECKVGFGVGVGSVRAGVPVPIGVEVGAPLWVVAV